MRKLMIKALELWNDFTGTQAFLVWFACMMLLTGLLAVKCV